MSCSYSVSKMRSWEILDDFWLKKHIHTVSQPKQVLLTYLQYLKIVAMAMEAGKGFTTDYGQLLDNVRMTKAKTSR